MGGGDEEVRAKVREQLVAALQKATDELQVRGRVYQGSDGCGLTVGRGGTAVCASSWWRRYRRPPTSCRCVRGRVYQGSDRRGLRVGRGGAAVCEQLVAAL